MPLLAATYTKIISTVACGRRRSRAVSTSRKVDVGNSRGPSLAISFLVSFLRVYFFRVFVDIAAMCALSLFGVIQQGFSEM